MVHLLVCTSNLRSVLQVPVHAALSRKELDDAYASRLMLALFTTSERMLLDLLVFWYALPTCVPIVSFCSEYRKCSL